MFLASCIIPLTMMMVSVSFSSDLSFSLVLAAAPSLASYRGLAPNVEPPFVIEMDLAEGHEQLRPRGVETRLLVGGGGVGDDVGPIRLS